MCPGIFNEIAIKMIHWPQVVMKHSLVVVRTLRDYINQQLNVVTNQSVNSPLMIMIQCYREIGSSFAHLFRFERSKRVVQLNTRGRERP